ncbi:MAG: helix-turn-helix transcriptional regulator [Lachnospiraceae bacterium]|nr:helix-turn-helix transcriptional regulator [Lachnospiraceae bacterium]
MKESMGQIIRRLRKERNLTQEELAEQLGVTFQAVSKWENDTGLPDISQVIPLATVFSVSTDVLFGIYGTDHEAEVERIINSAQEAAGYPATTDGLRKRYKELQKGLEKYPNNIALLCQCLEAGMALAYPENDVYDAENGELIYKECIREANVVIKYGKSTTDVLRAHMIMVLLHSAYGNFEAADAHAEEFPWRADMTEHEMKAYIAHFAKDYRAEKVCCQTDVMYHFEAMLDNIVQMGCCYRELKDYEKAECVYRRALALIQLVCKEETVKPHLHYRERGDIYSLLAELYLEQGRKADALETLKQMVDYDACELAKHEPGSSMSTPLLNEVEYDFYWSYGQTKEKLLLKLQNPAFEELKDDERFVALCKRAEE